MERLILVGAITLGAVGLAAVLRRNLGSSNLAVPGPEGWALPTHVDRADFDRPEAPWLLAVFTSATCATCADLWERARVMEAPEVVVAEAEYRRRPDLHTKYGIEAVPALAVVDAQGAVRRWLLGPAAAGELWSAVAEAREQA